MKTKSSFLLLFVVLPFLNLYAQNTWNAQTSGTSTHLYSVSFADRYNGWAVGESGIIIHTVNGGKTWITQTSGVTSPLNSVCFANNLKGWAVGNSGKIIHTFNGGATWLPQTSGTTQQLNGVSFADSSNAWAVGVNGTLLHTNNGGANWRAQTSAVAPSCNAVKFVSKTKGWAVANMGKIIYTNDSGATWTVQTSSTSINLMGVSFADANYGWAVGLNGTIVHTKNGGAKWAAQSSTITDALLSVFFTDTLTGWAVGINGKIISTTDGGTSWAVQTSGLTSNLRSIFFYNESPGWIVGNDGKILYTKKSEEICLITVDTNTNRYKIMWEKFGGMGTASYNVYKEQGTSNYVLIGTVPFKDPAQFTDVNSRPENKEEKYKISAVDSLSIESAKSPYHKPMFMQASTGVPTTNVNLDWNFYEDESGKFKPTWYYIYRGTSPGGLMVIDSVSGTTNKFTDVNVFTNYYYRVGFIKDNPCDVITTRAQTNSGPYSQSVSNLKDYGVVGKDYLQAYPDNIIISKEMQTINITVMTNLSTWNSVSSQPTWLIVTNDIANKNISAIITPNTGNNSRNGIITISTAGQPDKIVNVTQDGLFTSISKDIVAEDIVIYQDPSGSSLNVIIPNPKLNLSSFELFDLTGKRIMMVNLKKYGLISIPVNGLKQGIYLVKVTGEKILTKKIYIN